MQSCSPEEAGIPSAALEAYLARLQEMRLVLHDVLIMRHGKLVLEAYWKPMDPSFRHRLYSASKSYVSCAVGVLIDQGILHLNDRAISFFPDKAPSDPHPWLAEMTIRDLLRMSTCWTKGASYTPEDTDWESTFFRDPPSHKPGMVFSYCTTATTMLCMIVKRVSGKEFTEILRPVFDELKISRDLYCIQSPCGHDWGGSGIMSTPREFALFADLVMHYGNHDGKQLLPYAYLKEATTKQIDNSLYQTNIDKGMGYGYQFWCTRNGGFLFNGMGAQFALCLPDQDLVLVTNGYEQLSNREEIFEAFWRILAPELSDKPLPADQEALHRLTTKCEELELLRPDGALSSPLAVSVSGRQYLTSENSMGWKWVCFEFADNQGKMCWENETGKHILPFGFGCQVPSEFPETQYNGPTIGKPLGKGLYCYTSAAWTMENSLMIYCHITDMHLGQFRVAVTFEDNSVVLHTQKHAEFLLNRYDGYVTGYSSR